MGGFPGTRIITAITISPRGKYHHDSIVSMQNCVPGSELEGRMNRFRSLMDVANPDWEIAVIFSKINLFYFTGTMQDGMLVIPRDGEAVLWVRRSYERAVDESLFPQIQKMRSYRDAAEAMGTIPATVYLETELVPLALYQRLHEAFPVRRVPAGRQSGICCHGRSKARTNWNLWSGRAEIHRHVLEDLAPGILREGISEAEFNGELYSLMMREGHHGIVRFGMFESEVGLGLICFWRQFDLPHVP